MTPFVLVSGDFVTTGGMDRANFALADYLSRQGRPVALVAHRVDAALAGRPGVTVHRVPKPFGSYLLGGWPLAWAGREVAGRAAGSRVVVNGGNCQRADINWVHYLHAAYRPDVGLGFRRRLRERFERELHRRDERAAVAAARVVVCNSERTRQDAIRLVGVAPHSAVTVYLGTDPDRFHPPAATDRDELRRRYQWPLDRPVVAFVGSPGDRRKGFETVLAAWQVACRAADWDALLVVIGRDAGLPVWDARVRAAGLAERVRFLGFRSDVPDLLRAADVLVSPTRYEAYGLGVHEAICCGLPAIVSADAGVAERYPSALGDWLLPDPDDAADLATKLRHWRADVAGSRGRFAAFSAALRSHTWDDMAEQFLRAVGEAPN